MDKSRRTPAIEIPAEATPEAPRPMVAFAGGDTDDRDVTKPVCYDEKGRPLYAPRGIRVRLPWAW